MNDDPLLKEFNFATFHVFRFSKFKINRFWYFVDFLSPCPAHGIDGYNVDWEVPGQWASDPECHDTLAFLTAFGARLAAASPPIGVRMIINTQCFVLLPSTRFNFTSLQPSLTNFIR